MRHHGSELSEAALDEIDQAGNWMGMHCAEFAVALHRKFGYPLFAAPDSDGLIHVFCRVRGDLFCDAYGLRPLSLIADEFILIQPDNDYLEEEWGITEEILRQRCDGGCFDEYALRSALELISKHQEWFRE